MPNAFEPDWDEPRDQPGMRSRRAPIGRPLGTARLAMTLQASSRRADAGR